MPEMNLKSSQPPSVDLEHLRDFVIQHAVMVTEETGRNLDVVPLLDLVEFYEEQAKRDFYKNRAAPHIPDGDIPPHTFANYTPSGICWCGDRNCQGHSE